MRREFTEYYGPLTADRVLEMHNNGLFEYKPESITKAIYPSIEDRKSLIGTGTVVFDANALLDIYKLSQDALNLFDNICEKLDGRIWISYQAASEYNRRLSKVIADEYKRLSEICLSIATVGKNGSNQHFLNSPHIRGAFDELVEKAEAERDAYYVRCEQLKERIADRFMDKVGPKPKDGENEDLLAKAKARHEKRMPPGYKDEGKPDNAKYGDAIGWIQTLDMAETTENGVLIVTNERKEDWWLRVAGNIHGPRPEMVIEMRSCTKKNFWMYSLENFMRHGADYFQLQTGDDVATELKALEDSRVIFPLREKLGMRGHLTFPIRQTLFAGAGEIQLLWSPRAIAEMNQLSEKQQQSILALIDRNIKAPFEAGIGGSWYSPDVTHFVFWFANSSQLVTITHLVLNLVDTILGDGHVETVNATVPTDKPIVWMDVL